MGGAKTLGLCLGGIIQVLFVAFGTTMGLAVSGGSSVEGAPSVRNICLAKRNSVTPTYRRKRK